MDLVQDIAQTTISTGEVAIIRLKKVGIGAVENTMATIKGIKEVTGITEKAITEAVAATKADIVREVPISPDNVVIPQG